MILIAVAFGFFRWTKPWRMNQLYAPSPNRKRAQIFRLSFELIFMVKVALCIAVIYIGTSMPQLNT
ncbi:hypothetical protein BK651_09330 [Pseudomonas rhodesiae]|nr:hypothetical protein BK650_18155 [Pseudomonas rhodesiae]ROM66263.1 hypothetical protein BK651_09330 [Pseudomonas rhodesiae]